MRKIYLLAVSALIGASAMAQVSVTFRVDMNDQVVSSDGVHVAGNWQDDAGFPGEWQPGTSEMTDANTDGIYELNVTIPPGQYEFKYINGNAWGSDEGVPTISQKGGGNINRFFGITDWHASNGGLTLPAIKYAGSSPVGKVAVRLQIDMINQTIAPEGVHVAGDAIEPTWTPEYGTATESSNSKYAFLTYVNPSATYNYKFINGDFWTSGTGAAQDENVVGACASGGNRVLVVATSDVTTDANCFGVCDLCAPVFQATVIFKVNMTQETVSPNGVHVAGDWQAEAGFGGDWQPGASQMLDGDGDGIYELTVELVTGTYAYKFINGNAWDGADNSNEPVPAACNVAGNRQMELVEGQNIFEFCYNQCTAACITNPDAANITFRVHMGNETVAPEGVWLMGSFTSPAWQSGAIQMSVGSTPNVYEATVLIEGSADIRFKFANGAPTSTEENGNFTELGCGVSNGIGGWDRTHTRSGQDEVLNIVDYNLCTSILSVANAEYGQVRIYPNPSSGVSFIELENPNSHSLRMSIVDITGKVVNENLLITSNRFEIKTSSLSPGLYFLNVVNERSERAVYKLMVK